MGLTAFLIYVSIGCLLQDLNYYRILKKNEKHLTIPLTAKRSSLLTVLKKYPFMNSFFDLEHCVAGALRIERVVTLCIFSP